MAEIEVSLEDDGGVVGGTGEYFVSGPRRTGTFSVSGTRCDAGAGENGWSPKECNVGDIDKAEGLFRSGCACSQAVLGTYGPRFGLKEDEAMRVSAGFAGGMRVAETCGAVTGAIMVLGLAYCDEKCRTAEERKRAYEKVVSFAEEFRARHASLACRDLLGCDISTPEGARAATEKGLFRSKCPELVRSAAEMVEARLPSA